MLHAQKENQMDMLHGPLLLKILIFAIPLAASSMLQQLFNSADVAVVGRFAGQSALAAVGANTAIVSLFVNIFTGLAVGTNVVLAQLIGKGDKEKISDVVHTSVLLGVLIGIVLIFSGQFISRTLLTAIGAPDEVMDEAVLYLRIYFAAMPFMAVYNFGAAVLRSVGDTKRPMYCLIATGILNICLNLIFVIAFKMGVAGVALATVIANAVSMVIILVWLMREEGEIRLIPSKLHIDPESLKQIILLGGPAAIQSMVFSISNVCIQGAINSFGTSAIAGSAAAVNFEYIDYFLINAFNQAAVTFVGQNYAAGEKKRCLKIFCYCLAESVIGVMLLMSLFFGFRGFFIGLFTQDPEVVSQALIRMRYVLSLHFLGCTYEVTGSVIRGMGKSLLPAVIMVIGSVVLRLIWLGTVFERWHTLKALFLVYPCSWIFTGTVMFIAFYIIYRKYLRD